jgi:hypothetical protein
MDQEFLSAPTNAQVTLFSPDFRSHMSDFINMFFSMTRIKSYFLPNSDVN